MLRKMYLIPTDRLHGSSFMAPEPTVSKREHRETVKKRKHNNPYAEAIKIRKHHPYEEWLKMHHKMDEADLRKKTETNAFADILSLVMTTGQASKVSPLHHLLLLRLRLKNAPWDTDDCNVGIGYRIPTTTD